jgi:fermentation-respiration switch protein FrsA (DUF1100 family)
VIEHAAPPLPAESGRLNGIAYCLWLPEAADGALPAVLVLHGAGSQKENHSDFARTAVGHGFAALTFDNRGHGESDGDMGPGVIDDIDQLARFLGEREEVDAGRIAVRGSSMGGLLAIHAAATSDALSALVAICPAAEKAMLPQIRRVAEGQVPPQDSYLASMRIDANALVPWLESNDVGDAVEQIGSKPTLFIHAKGDETVPYSRSEELYERAAKPKKLWLLDGGDHRSAQHDAEIQGESLRWLLRSM